MIEHFISPAAFLSAQAENLSKSCTLLSTCGKNLAPAAGCDIEPGRNQSERALAAAFKAAVAQEKRHAANLLSGYTHSASSVAGGLDAAAAIKPL
jgi:hypothetical protein